MVGLGWGRGVTHPYRERDATDAKMGRDVRRDVRRAMACDISLAAITKAKWDPCR